MSKEENLYVRIDHEYDPERCGAVVAGSRQCHYKRLEGSQYCPAHGGKMQQDHRRKQALTHYRLAQYDQRLGQLSGSGEIKSLREEIAIVRLTLENLLNQCKTPNQLLIYTDKISMLTGQVAKLIESCQKIEERNSNLLDKQVVLVIADEIINIISRFIKNPDALQEAGETIVRVITDIGSVQQYQKVLTDG